jgi:hypothetical protein
LNPYSPPQAPVGDVAGPAPLPVSVRVVRGFAVMGSALNMTVIELLRRARAALAQNGRHSAEAGKGRE